METEPYDYDDDDDDDDYENPRDDPDYEWDHRDEPDSPLHWTVAESDATNTPAGDVRELVSNMNRARDEYVAEAMEEISEVRELTELIQRIREGADEIRELTEQIQSIKDELRILGSVI